MPSFFGGFHKLQIDTGQETLYNKKKMPLITIWSGKKYGENVAGGKNKISVI